MGLGVLISSTASENDASKTWYEIMTLYFDKAQRENQIPRYYANNSTYVAFIFFVHDYFLKECFLLLAIRKNK